jgi:RNA polymerase sigma-70 factor, ECF subfamily
MEASRLAHAAVLDDATFDRLVRTHRSPLERYARSLGASQEDAEEIAATALLRAYQHPPAARRDQEWRAWLSTVAQNLFIDARRRRQVRLVAGDDVIESVPSPGGSVEQVAATAEEARQICAAIALLPPMQRAAIYLREVRGHSYEEIADELGITLKAVTATLHRARDGVRRRHGGLAQALSGLALTPLGVLRRGAGAARLATASASGTAAQIAIPVALVAGAGGVAIAAQHTLTATPRRVATVSAPQAAATRAKAPTVRVASVSTAAGRSHGQAAAAQSSGDPTRATGSPTQLPHATASATTAATSASGHAATPGAGLADVSQTSGATPEAPGKPAKPDHPDRPAKPGKPDGKAQGRAAPARAVTAGTHGAGPSARSAAAVSAPRADADAKRAGAAARNANAASAGIPAADPRGTPSQPSAAAPAAAPETVAPAGPPASAGPPSGEAAAQGHQNDNSAGASPPAQGSGGGAHGGQGPA